jgi:hypothetical protein
MAEVKQKRTTYVSIVKAAVEAGKTNDEILAIIATELPQMDVKKAKSKLAPAIKYVKGLVAKPKKAAKAV